MAVVPLQWSLRGGNTELASMRGPSYDQYAQWAYPGEAKLRLRATAAPGAVNEKSLNAAVRRSAARFKRCANKVMATAAGTFVVGLKAVLTSDARLVNVRTEISSADGLGPCFERALRSVTPPSPLPDGGDPSRGRGRARRMNGRERFAYAPLASAASAVSTGWEPSPPWTNLASAGRWWPGRPGPST